MEVLDPTTVDEALSEGIAWERDGRELVKVQTEDDFAGALDFVNRVGELAERADHHPDIEIKWNTVTRTSDPPASDSRGMGARAS